MKFVRMFGWLPIALGLSAGCDKAAVNSSAPASIPAPVEQSLPTHAQPKLKTMKFYLGAETLDVELALTWEQERTGMMFRTNLTDKDAMFFVLTEPQRASFWMTNCPESLSAAYITPEGVIAEIHHLEKNDNVGVVANSDNILYVLEVKDGWYTRHNISTGTVVRTEKGTLRETFSP
jgi:hypothetical protein